MTVTVGAVVATVTVTVEQWWYRSGYSGTVVVTVSATVLVQWWLQCRLQCWYSDYSGVNNGLSGDSGVNNGLSGDTERLSSQRFRRTADLVSLRLPLRSPE